MGRQFGKPQYASFRYAQLARKRVSATFLDLLWIGDSGCEADITQLPSNRYFRGAECVSLRSAWNDAEALVAVFTAGGNNQLLAHRHLDLGSFLLEADGERWAVDPGGERQTYMQHEHTYEKWEFYRMRAEGHNTLVINPGCGPDQELDAETRIIHYSSDAKGATATADLTDAYRQHANRVHRTLAMKGDGVVSIRDEVRATAPSEVGWFMHTHAEAELEADGSVAVLRQNGKQVAVEIVEPEGAVFSILEARPLPTSPNPESQEKNENLRKLAIQITDVAELRLTVRILNRSGDG
jgi:hypothetical protein